MNSRLILKGEFSRNVFTLMTGTILAQAIPVAIAPILTRIYSPEDFGIFALYMAISSIIGVVATGRYELAIMLPKKDIDAANLVVLSVVITIIVSSLVFLVVFFLNESITKLLGNPELSVWLYFLPLSVLLTGSYQILNYWNNRKKYYKNIAISRIIKNSTMVGTQVTTGLAGLDSGGLIVGGMVGQGIATATLGRMLWKEDKAFISNTTRLKKIALARRYIDFPKYLIVAHILNTASSQSPIILLNSLFTSSTAGFYSLTVRVISVPMSIVARAIGDVFRQEASHTFASKGECAELYNKTLKKLLLISILPFLLFFIVAPELFAMVFGESWRVAGEYAQILTPMFFLKFVTNPLSLMFMVAEKQKLDLLWQIVLFIMTVSSIIVGHSFDSVKCTLILFSIVYSFMYIINGIMTALFSKGIYCDQ